MQFICHVPLHLDVALLFHRDNFINEDNIFIIREKFKCKFTHFIIPFCFLHVREHFMKMIAIPSTKIVVTTPTPAPIPSPTVMFNYDNHPLYTINFSQHLTMHTLMHVTYKQLHNYILTN